MQIQYLICRAILTQISVTLLAASVTILAIVHLGKFNTNTTKGKGNLLLSRYFCFFLIDDVKQFLANYSYTLTPLNIYGEEQLILC